MTLVLDSGGVSALAGNRARLAELARRGMWPPVVPAVVLVESLTGDHRRDFHTNHLLRMSVVRDVVPQLARDAARLRFGTGRPGDISATDAIVVAEAARCPEPVIVTSDSGDIRALVAGVESFVGVVEV